MAGVWRRLFGKAERDALRPLYQGVVREGRRTDWYAAGGVPDTIEGRFDMVAAVLSLVLLRLEHADEEGRAPSAYLVELFVADMDSQLRERGIGDIVVGKHIGRLMGALGGRLGAFREAFAGGDLDGVIARNIHRGAAVGAEQAAFMREHLKQLRAALAMQPVQPLLEGNWPR